MHRAEQWIAYYLLGGGWGRGGWGSSGLRLGAGLPLLAGFVGDVLQEEGLQLLELLQLLQLCGLRLSVRPVLALLSQQLLLLLQEQESVQLGQLGLGC